MARRDPHQCADCPNILEGLYVRCPGCIRIRALAYAKVYNKDHKVVIPPKKRKEYARRYFEKNLLYSAKHRAKQQGLPFNLDLSDMVVPDVCPVLGIRLEKSGGHRNPALASLDKIIPKLGYVKGNVCIISWRANLLKSDGSLEDFEALCRYVRDRKAA